jgi:hypothetical protein
VCLAASLVLLQPAPINPGRAADPAPESGNALGFSCAEEDVVSGACLPYAVNPGEEIDPRVAAVRLAVETGNRSAARAFFRENSGEWPAAIRTDAQTQLNAQASEPSLGSPGPAAAQMAAGGVDERIAEKEYGYCGPSNCNLAGRVKIEMRMSLSLAPKLLLSGDIDRVSGPLFYVADGICRIRYERNNLPDSTVKTWPQCDGAASSTSATNHRDVQATSVTFTGTNNEKYHSDYGFRINPVGEPPAFVINFKSRTWRYTAGIGPTFVWGTLPQP